MKTKIPQLKPGERSVFFSEVDTGILTGEDGQRILNEGTYFRAFQSNEEAEAFAKQYIRQHPKIECSIRDEAGRFLRFIRSEK